MNEQLEARAAAPLPESVGRCADEYAWWRQLRLAMEKEVNDVHAVELRYREHIIATLSKSQDTGVAGMRYRAQIVHKQKIGIGDWAALTAWIRHNGRFEFLQKRLSDKAVVEWAEENGTLPAGTIPVDIVDVSITKI